MRTLLSDSHLGWLGSLIIEQGPEMRASYQFSEVSPQEAPICDWDSGARVTEASQLKSNLI